MALADVASPRSAVVVDVPVSSVIAHQLSDETGSAVKQYELELVSIKRA